MTAGPSPGWDWGGGCEYRPFPWPGARGEVRVPFPGGDAVGGTPTGRRPGPGSGQGGGTAANSDSGQGRA